MHDISNGIKHFQLSRPKSNIKSVEVHHGAFDNSFDNSFDISHLEIKFEAGEPLDLNQLIDNVFMFWKEFLEVEEVTE